MAEPIETDVLVVGAGPGGSAAAYHLARHGIDVTLVDKASFPREKVCGDGLTPRSVGAIQRMGIDTDDPGFERVLGLRVHSKDVTVDLPWPELRTWPDFGLVMPRLGFDQLLLERAKKAGAHALEETEARRPLVEDGWVVGAETVQADAPGAEPVEIRARFTVAADGAASRGAPGGGGRGPGAAPPPTPPDPWASPRVATTGPRTSRVPGSSPGSTCGIATCSCPATAGCSRWPTDA